MLNLTYTDALSAYAAYPSPIRPYLLRAETHPIIRQTLTKSFMRAFIDLLSRANIADPSRPIQVRIDLTAERLGISAKTVSRTIGLMLDRAWLYFNESHDGRNWEGKYAGREFIVSDSLRTLVGLPCAETDPSTGPGSDNGSEEDSGREQAPSKARSPGLAYQSADVNNTGCKTAPTSGSTSGKPAVDNHVDNGAAHPTELSDGSASYPQNPAKNVPERTEMSDGHIGVNNVFLLKEASLHKGAFVIEDKDGKTVRVPTDLAELHTVFGISGKGICALMKLARDVRQRLQDVWTAKREQILKAGALGGRAVNYLRKLLSSGEDFSYIARCKTPNPDEVFAPEINGKLDSRQPAPAVIPQVQPEDQATVAADAELLKLGKSCANKKFRNVVTGAIVRFFDANADVSRGTKSEIYGGWAQMKKLYLDVARGDLVEVGA